MSSVSAEGAGRELKGFQFQQHLLIIDLCLTSDLSFRENPRLHSTLSTSGHVSKGSNTILTCSFAGASERKICTWNRTITLYLHNRKHRIYTSVWLAGRCPGVESQNHSCSCNRRLKSLWKLLCGIRVQQRYFTLICFILEMGQNVDMGITEYAL